VTIESIIYRIFVVALWTFIKNSRTLINGAQLHCIKILFWMSALRAGFLNYRMLLFVRNSLITILLSSAILVIFAILQPSRLRFRRASCNHFIKMKLGKVCLEAACRTVYLAVVGGFKNSSAAAIRPIHWTSRLIFTSVKSLPFEFQLKLHMVVAPHKKREVVGCAHNTHMHTHTHHTHPHNDQKTRPKNDFEDMLR
jgi:hypothetical protein